jgi:calpain-15
MLSIAYWL